jgi:hypothetical protein
MLSVVIATAEDERALVATLSALVPGAAAGVVREVLLAAGTVSGLTERIADASGCVLMRMEGARGAALASAAREAKSEWLMFLPPGAVPEHGWIDDVAQFMEMRALGAGGAPRAAIFGAPRLDNPLNPVELLRAMRRAVSPAPDQGLIIARAHYHDIGGHAPGSADPERAILSRIPRGRRVTLRTCMVAI